MFAAHLGLGRTQYILPAAVVDLDFPTPHAGLHDSPGNV
jgi:hypothetical protein